MWVAVSQVENFPASYAGQCVCRRKQATMNMLLSTQCWQCSLQERRIYLTEICRIYNPQLNYN